MAPPMSDKLELLIKMMKMTSAEDNVALVALRKANTLLDENGWDWETILRGKVKIVEDPFKSVNATHQRVNTPPPPAYVAPAPPPPQPVFRPSPPPPGPNPAFRPAKPSTPPRPAYSPNYNTQGQYTRPRRGPKRKPTTSDILDIF